VANGEWAILPFLYSSVMPVSLRHLVPLFFVAALGISLVLSPWSLWPLAAVALPYLAASSVASVQVAVREKRPHFAVLMPAVFFTLHLGYGLGSLSGLGKLAALGRTSHGPRTKETPCLPQP
jgi:hypothetical protein